MQSNKSRDTKPELALRSAVHSLGLRYRVDARPLKALRRRADLVFPRAKVAVFLDGCFWHGCPVHHTVAAANASFWAEKVSTNRARDSDTDAKLAERPGVGARRSGRGGRTGAGRAARTAGMTRLRTGSAVQR
jgi:DNA mismatch endonuclease (patch repair protein)